MKVDIRPFVASFQDYHDMCSLDYCFDKAGVKIEYKEIGWLTRKNSEIGQPFGYIGVFWVENCSIEEMIEAEKLIDKYEKLVDRKGNK